LSNTGGATLNRASLKQVSGVPCWRWPGERFDMMNKSRRTIFLAALAMATLVWSAIYHFGVPAQEMAWLFAYSALGVLLIVLLAAIAVALLQGVKMLRRKNSGQARRH
jgi:hypothetical protein